MLCIIPARYASTRFPGKPLVMLGDRSMIQRVYEQAQKAPKVQKVIVATDDPRIFEHVQAFGGEVLMTLPDHQSGTDRCAEVAAQFPGFEYVINVQGDEPFVQPEQIDLLCQTLEQATGGIATLAKLIKEEAQLTSPNVVKVVLNKAKEALYFSRYAIPYLRGVDAPAWVGQSVHHKHIGLYGFRSEVLQKLAQLPHSQLELAESLEQLRWLDNGFRIKVGITELETMGIDTPEDVQRCIDGLKDGSIAS